ncbi:BRO domain protein [Ruminiclostridium papyrosolvens DSM 2782]|uniref:BRO domain protein n=1 Tax=Ruminiclostridium papyrosolvens DSM 2782 TaxID=588581 RepID=F1TEI1_9FIRM|nr:BRO family protein [Ruminiclostridium papyrosolvens]EGD47147.1 BRO domain protein [Ruminiclostridium papyrosolvens DSM 2782]WES36089.1 BRO family protein [Ruminiclostridium papyrosolvens DSM 2782]WES36187.1 BRO family protein [Ruminiclostridium papyrosolvens DSM 2782]
MQLIKSESFGSVQCDVWKDENGEMWFTREQIGQALEYGTPRIAIANIHERNADRIDKFSAVVKLSTPSGIQETYIYSHKGLNEICRFSRQPKADAFMDWVWEVIESIRKHGMYAKDELLDNPDLMIEVITQLKKEREEKKLLQTENKLLSQEKLTWADRKVIEAIVKKIGSNIGYDVAWKEFKKELLYSHGICLNSRITNWRNSTGKKTGPRTLDMIDDDELQACLATATASARHHGIDISDIIKKFEKSA